MKERKLGLAKRLSAMALALVMVFSLLSLSDLKALAAGDTAPTAAEDWTYDSKGHDLIVAPGQALDDAYTVYYAVTDTDDEPDAPNASNLGAWTFNWRDDEQFVATNSGEYYLWWCAYDSEEDEFSTEPELFDVVTVEKATPLGSNPTGVTVEWNDDVQSLVANVGGVPFDPSISHYEYAVTDADEEDPANYSWGKFFEGATYQEEVGEYKVWYQLKYDGKDDNYQDGAIGYVESEITAKALIATNSSQTVLYAGEGADKKGVAPTVDSLQFVNSAGIPKSPTITYSAKQKDLTKDDGKKYVNDIQSAFKDAAEDSKFAAKSYKVYYTAELTGYETVSGVATITVAKNSEAQATAPEIDNTKQLVANSGTTVQLIDKAGTSTKTLATDSIMYYQVKNSNQVPSTSGIGTSWKSDITDSSLAKGAGKYYVYYMVASAGNSNVEPKILGYKTVTVADKDHTVSGQTYKKSPATTYTLTYTRKAQNLIPGTTADEKANYPVSATTDATIQYCVVENNSEMPYPNADWFTLGNTETIKRTNAGTYYIWYRTLQKTNGTAIYAETNPTCVTVTIDSDEAKLITDGNGDYTNPATVDALTYTGRNQALLTAGTAKNGLAWYYIAEDSKGNIVHAGTTVPKMKDADTYTVTSVLIDTSFVWIDKDTNKYISNFKINEVAMRLTNLPAVAVWGANTPAKGETVVPIAKYPAEVTDPLVVEDFEYDAEEHSLIAEKGKTDKGNLYYLVTDANGKIVSIDGKATNAGDYDVNTMVTELSTFEVAMAVAQANLVAPYLTSEAGAGTVTPLDFIASPAIAAKLGFDNIYTSSNIWAEPEGQGSVTIETIDPFALGVSPVTTQYTGHPQDIAEEGTTLSESIQIYYMAYDEDGEEVWDEWTRIVPRATAEGEYTIGYKVVNVEWNEDTNFTEGETEEVKLEEKSEITEGQAELLVAPVGLGLNANGSEQALVEEGLADNGTIMYALGTEEAPYPGVEWKAEVPEASEEGTYHVWYYVAGDEGFADTDPAHVDAVIGQETTLYRIFNPATGEHIYTYDANEVANATQNLGWTLDGTVSGTTAGTKPVYRLMDLIHGVHIYSTDDNEVQTLVAAGVAQLEGVQFYTVPQAEGTDDYYRLSSPDFPHHYTNDWNEINSLVESGVYTLDGYAWSFPGTSN